MGASRESRKACQSFGNKKLGKEYVKNNRNRFRYNK